MSGEEYLLSTSNYARKSFVKINIYLSFFHSYVDIQHLLLHKLIVKFV